MEKIRVNELAPPDVDYFIVAAFPVYTFVFIQSFSYLFDIDSDRY